MLLLEALKFDESLLICQHQELKNQLRVIQKLFLVELLTNPLTQYHSGLSACRYLRSIGFMPISPTGFLHLSEKMVSKRSQEIKSFYFCPTLTTCHAGDD